MGFTVRWAGNSSAQNSSLIRIACWHSLLASITADLVSIFGFYYHFKVSVSHTFRHHSSKEMNMINPGCGISSTHKIFTKWQEGQKGEEVFTQKDLPTPNIGWTFIRSQTRKTNKYQCSCKPTDLLPIPSIQATKHILLIVGVVSENKHILTLLTQKYMLTHSHVQEKWVRKKYWKPQAKALGYVYLHHNSKK